jgi:hypothetical protein
VRHAGDDDALEVGEDVGERLAARRRRRRELGAHVAGRHPREHRIALGLREVAGDPVDERVGVVPELRDREVAGSGGGSGAGMGRLWRAG